MYKISFKLVLNIVKDLSSYRIISLLRGAYDKFPDFFRMGTFIDSHHHHDVVLLARISLILSRHFSLSFIAFGRS